MLVKIFPADTPDTSSVAQAEVSKDLPQRSDAFLCDGIYLRLRPEDEKAVAVLCAYGIREDAKKVLLHLAVGDKESTVCWKSFFQDLKQRGLVEPLLVILDGHSGLRKAVRDCFPGSWVQRCQVHRMRNILCKLPEKARPGIKKLIRKAFTAQSHKAGLEQAQAVVAMYEQEYPEAMKCLATDLEEVLTALRFPENHRKRIRTTNLLERLFGEGRRRSKVVPRFMSERSGLSLMFAVLVDASAAWHGIKISPTVGHSWTDSNRAQMQVLQRRWPHSRKPGRFGVYPAGLDVYSCFVSEVTQILERAEQGDTHAAAELLPLVYEELRRLAAAKMANEAAGHTLQPTALVHEAWLRLAGSRAEHWNSRGHFFGAAAEAMRRILIERARKKARVRHGGKLERVELEHVTVAAQDCDEIVLLINEALEKLAAESPQKAEIVKLRYFVGMEHAEIAEALGIAEPTVRRHWAYARSWLYAELKARMAE
jgi:RNA polymerase sigma factor (TIGR02999 family)